MPGCRPGAPGLSGGSCASPPRSGPSVINRKIERGGEKEKVREKENDKGMRGDREVTVRDSDRQKHSYLVAVI